MVGVTTIPTNCVTFFTDYASNNAREKFTYYARSSARILAASLAIDSEQGRASNSGHLWLSLCFLISFEYTYLRYLASRRSNRSFEKHTALYPVVSSSFLFGILAIVGGWPIIPDTFYFWVHSRSTAAGVLLTRLRELDYVKKTCYKRKWVSKRYKYVVITIFNS